MFGFNFRYDKIDFDMFELFQVEFILPQKLIQTWS